MIESGQSNNPLKPLRVMLIDDDPNDRALVIRSLKKEFPGVRITEIIDAAALQASLASEEFDLVITDYHLCWTDGLKNLRAIKERYPDCPVIMFTGTGTEEVAVEAMKGGLDDYVLKSPKHFGRLPAAIRLVLEKAEQREAIRKAEARYRELYTGVPIGLFRSTPEGRFIEANPAMLEILGYSFLDEFLALNARELYLDRDDRRHWRRRIDEEGIIRNLEIRVRQRDGRAIWVRMTIRAIKDEQGEIIYYDGSLEDITVRKEMEIYINRLQKMESLGRLAGGIAHDFGNIMTAIASFAKTALRQITRDNPTYTDLEGIMSSVSRAIRLTRQLSAFSRKKAASLEMVDCDEIIKGMEEMLERLIQKDITSRLELTPESKPVWANRAQLEQVIMNLVLNARDAMPEGGEFTIGTGVVEPPFPESGPESRLPPGAYILIRISDTGRGMDAETMAHVFEPLYTTKKEGEGTGLGLAVVYGNITRIGGYIDVESAVGKGTTFRIFLPRAENEEPED